MKSKLLKSVLVGILLTITVLSFRYASRTRGTQSRPSWGAAPRVVVDQSPPPRAEEWTERWEKFTHAGDEFSVEMPEEPFVYESDRSVSAFGGTEPVRTFGLYSGGVVLLVTAFDNPHAEESYETFATYHWPGRELVFSGGANAGNFGGKEYQSSGEYFTRARVFLARSHAYLVCALSQKSYDPRAAHFLDSFVLGGKPEGREIHDGPPPPEVKVPVAPPVISVTPLPSGGGVGPGSGISVDRAPGKPYAPGEVARKAIVVFKPPPGFTEEARLNEVTGVVILRAVLTAEGKVTNVSVVSGLPQGLTEKAVNAARHILFFPAAKDERAVSQWVTLKYNFNIY